MNFLTWRGLGVTIAAGIMFCIAGARGTALGLFVLSDSEYSDRATF